MTEKEIIKVLDESNDVEIETKDGDWFVGTVAAIELEDKIDDDENPQVLLRTDEGGIIIEIKDILNCKCLD